MKCEYCGSRETKTFQAEMSLPFPGIERINVAPVYLCPQILICLNCGTSRFSIPPRNCS
jgi:hypothetical protein